MNDIRLSDLTLAGWVLTLVTVLMTIVLMFLSAALWSTILPEGRYPTFLLVLPGIIVAGLFFVSLRWLLSKLNIPITRSSRDR